jgi:uncharacterized protein
MTPSLVKRPADWPREALILVVRGYRLLLKPWLGNACRFEPSCSAYTLAALQRHGALRGSVLGTGRLLRCHPWCEGGHDPVPTHFAGSPRPAHPPLSPDPSVSRAGKHP